MSRPVEPVAAVLRAPEMRSYALVADAAWTEGRLSVHDLRLFWKWRCWRRDQGFKGIVECTPAVRQFIWHSP